jgi:hypothetical protein
MNSYKISYNHHVDGVNSFRTFETNSDVNLADTTQTEELNRLVMEDSIKYPSGKSNSVRVESVEKI